MGVSPLTRPDSFNAGSCRSEREDRVTAEAFDVRVMLGFEDTAHSLPLFAFLSFVVSDSPSCLAMGRQTLPVTQSEINHSIFMCWNHKNLT